MNDFLVVTTIVYLVVTLLFFMFGVVEGAPEDFKPFNNLVKIIFFLVPLAILLGTFLKNIRNHNGKLINFLIGDFRTKFKFKVGDYIENKEGSIYLVKQLNYLKKHYVVDKIKDGAAVNPVGITSKNTGFPLPGVLVNPYVVRYTYPIVFDIDEESDLKLSVDYMKNEKLKKETDEWLK